MNRPDSACHISVALLLMCSSLPFVGSPAGAQTPQESTRVCLVFPSVELAAGDAAHAAEAVRTSFAAYLTGPTLQPASLSARVPMQAELEARDSRCDYVVHTTVVHKRGRRSPIGRAAQTVARPAATHVAVNSTMGHVARVTTISGIYAAAELAASVQLRDEISFTYRLHRLDEGQPLLQRSSKATARATGEDLLTPQIAAAAEEIAGAVTQR